MTEDQKLKRIYQKILTDSILYAEDYPMQMVAATYLAIAMRLYKTILSPKEYNDMLKTIEETEIKPYKKPGGTLH
jgi:hypothetical protein